MNNTTSDPWIYSAFSYKGHALRYAVYGNGPTFLFQHGLGADCLQSLNSLLPLTHLGFRVVALDCPGHGESSLAALEMKASFELYTDVLIAFIEAMEIGEFVMGGISMGSGLTLGVANRLTAMGQDFRMRAMVLVRPAWLDQTHPENLALIERVGEWIEAQGLLATVDLLEHDEQFKNLRENNPQCALSVSGLLHRPHAQEHAPTLRQMIASRPLTSLSGLPSIPALVISNEGDPLHPSEIAETLSCALPNASLQKIASRYLNAPQHNLELNGAIASFLNSTLRTYSPSNLAMAPLRSSANSGYFS